MKARPLTIKDIVPMGDYNTCDILSAVEWLKQEMVKRDIWDEKCIDYDDNCVVCKMYILIDEAFQIK